MAPRLCEALAPAGVREQVVLQDVEARGAPSEAALHHSPPPLSASIEGLFVPSDEGEDTVLQGLEVEGRLPSWLQGKLLNAGPGKWHIGGERFQGLLDCQAMVQELSIADSGSCSFRRRHVETESLRSHVAKGQIAAREMYSRPELPNLWERLRFAFSAPPQSQNGFQMVSSLAGGSRLMTTHHACQFMEVSPHDLSTIGPLQYADRLEEDSPFFYNTEPSADPNSGEVFFGGIRFNTMLLQFELVLYCFEADQSCDPGAPVQRRLVKSIPLGSDATAVPTPHQVWVSENYLVCMTSPLRMDLLRSVQCEVEWIATGEFSGEGRSAWKSGSGVDVYVVSRATGDLVKTFALGEDIYPTHISNIFERSSSSAGGGTELVLDMLANELDASAVCGDETSMFAFSLASETEEDLWGEFGNSIYRRLRLDLDSGRAALSAPWLAAGAQTACAKVNPRVRMQQNRLSFSIGSTDAASMEIVKLDHDTGDAIAWISGENEKGHELEFVPDPDGKAEDAGVVLCWLTNTVTLRSRVVVIDAVTMETIGSILLPESQHSPVLLHGAFLQTGA